MFKPCPFCGSANLESGGDDKIVAVRCRDCEATGPNHYGSRAEWNTRSLHLPEPQTAPDEICILCANGNDLPEGETCPGCKRAGHAVGLAAAVIKARGRNKPPSTPVKFGAAPADAERLALAERIEAWMRDHASAGEGAVFDLCPDHQLLVISALRTESSCLSEQEKSAVKNLRNHQDQCDADGVMVKVSRQALDETLAAIDRLIKAGNPLIVSSLRAGGWREDMENGRHGFIVSSADETRFRFWDAMGPTWTTDRVRALRFARRIDAERFAAEDEDAWKILEVAPAAPKNTDKEG